MEKKIFEKDGLFYINYCELEGLKKENDKLFAIGKCQKCNGTGFIRPFLHIENGLCFNCNGTGIIKTKIKSFKSLKNAENSIKREEQKILEKKQKLYNETLQKIDNLKMEKIYILSPENDTFSIKEKLFENGCVFRKYFYKNNKIGIENLKLFELNVKSYILDNTDLFKNCNTSKQFLYSLASFIDKNMENLYNEKQTINMDFTDFAENKKYVFDITRILAKKRFDNRFGTSTFYILLDNNKRKIKYITSKILPDKELIGKIEGTIKQKTDDLLVITRIKKVI